MSATSGAKRLRGRLLTPASSPPVRSPRQRCALLPKQKKHSGARRMVQAEGFGWQRCAASADLGGAAAAGVLQEGWRQEAGAKGGASRLPLTFCLLRFQGLYLGKLPQTPLHLLPTPTPSPDVGDVGGEASSGRLLSPDSSPPVRCLRQRCALLPKQKNIRARGGWRRMKDWADEGAPRPLI